MQDLEENAPSVLEPFQKMLQFALEPLLLYVDPVADQPGERKVQTIDLWVQGVQYMTLARLAVDHTRTGCSLLWSLCCCMLTRSLTQPGKLRL